MDNTIPQPVDVARLASILGKAKNIMKAAESGNYQTGNIDASKLVQDTNNYVNESNVSQDMIQHSYGDATRAIGSYDEQTIMNSKLPESVKRAMLENPINLPNNPISHTFNLEDVSHLMEDKPMPPPTSRGRAVVNETYNNNSNNDMITISKSQLKDVVKDVLIEYLSNEYSKNLTENTIKKTINTLIKEGKINTKKSI
jgi:hypothetical protein